MWEQVGGIRKVMEVKQYLKMIYNLFTDLSPDIFTMDLFTTACILHITFRQLKVLLLAGWWPVMFFNIAGQGEDLDLLPFKMS